MRKTVMFLEQQTWVSGAQRVLEVVIGSLHDDFEPIVALPGNGPFRSALEQHDVATVLYALGSYRTGAKPFSEKARFCFRSILSALRLSALIRKHNTRLLYINGPRALAAGVLASKITGCPAVFHLHLTLTRRPEIVLVTSLARFVAKIIICSHAAARPLLNQDPRLAEKIHILYNPARQLRIEPPVKSSPPANASEVNLGMICRITETKGQQLLLEAVGALPAELRDKIRLTFIGAPEPGCARDIAYAERLQGWAKELGLEERILWTGYQTSPSSHLSKMDALVVASSPQAGESMPMVILEALQHGIPVIASRTGGVPEIIHDGWNGLLFSAGDINGFARTLERFLVDNFLRQSLRNGAGTGLDKRFSTEHFTSKVRALIEEVSAPPKMEHTEATVGGFAAWG